MNNRGGRGDRGGRGVRGGRGGRIAPGIRPVNEATRIDIAATLAEFQASEEKEYTFPPNLSNHDRAVVHAECKKYGFTSKSSGKGENRAVTVFKRRERRDTELVFELPLGNQTLSELNAYFTQYPPTLQELDAMPEGKGQIERNTKIVKKGNGDDTTNDTLVNNSMKEANEVGAGRKHSKETSKHASRFSRDELQLRRQQWEERVNRSTMQQIIAARASLPIASFRGEIVSKIRSNQIVLIAGETGCGKTTQVPQFILEDAWQQEQGCRIICTQPRRISAISVAERVAAERGEAIGVNVGYTIRLESRGGTDASLMFCTNGILLRMLTDQSSDAIRNVTHLVIDEIHERDRFADFLLILVRDILPTHPDLRVILMSATLHVELFSDYFGGCPVVRVPGFTYPVQDFYLEDVLRLTGYEAAAVQEIEAELGVKGCTSIVKRSTKNMDIFPTALSKKERKQVENAIESAFRTGDDSSFGVLIEVTGAAGTDFDHGGSPAINLKHPATGATALIAAAFWGRADVANVLLANGADPSIKANNGMDAIQCARQFKRHDVVDLLEDWEDHAKAADELASSALALSHYQASTDADEVDIGMIEALLEYICGEGRFKSDLINNTTGSSNGEHQIQGAVLIFLPGWDEIIRMKEKLEASPYFGRSNKYHLLPLHSMIAPQDQRRVFLRPPSGVRKIVISTNMAETAITIDDVVCVIDSGRLKEKSYDAFTGVSTLQGTWISKASERQRRGRAGRCQPGVAFHMYSRQRSDALAEFQLPELKRSPLDEMGLQVKLLERRDVQGVPDSGLSIAEFLAKAVEPPVPQAVDAAVRLLTDIGALDSEERLTNLGLHLAALPLPPALGKMLLYGVLYRCLDPILTVACCMSYRDPWVLPANPNGRYQASLLRGQWSTDAGGSSDHLATVKAFNGWLDAKARGFDQSYCAKNFLSQATMRMVDGMRTQLLGELINRKFIRSLEDASVEAERADLVRAVLGCGFYPMIGRLIPIKEGNSKMKTSVETRNGERVRIHPASVNTKLHVVKPLEESNGLPEYPALIFFDEITRGDSTLYIKSCTAMHAHPIVLVAANVVPAPEIIEHPDVNNDDEEELGDTRGMAMGMQSIDLNGEHQQKDIPQTGILIVDGWLKFRVPIHAISQIICLRHRVGNAFASKVNAPKNQLPDILQGAIEVSARLFINESESGIDGTETCLGTSFKFGKGLSTSVSGRNNKGRQAHLIFRYGHHHTNIEYNNNRGHKSVYDPIRSTNHGRRNANYKDDTQGVKRTYSGKPRQFSYQSNNSCENGSRSRGGGRDLRHGYRSQT